MFEIQKTPAPLRYGTKYRLNEMNVGEWFRVDRIRVNAVRGAIYKAQIGESLSGICKGWQFSCYQITHDSWAVKRTA